MGLLRRITGGRKGAMRADMNARIDRVAHLFKEARVGGPGGAYLNGETPCDIPTP
jgi:hypothetical protein